MTITTDHPTILPAPPTADTMTWNELEAWMRRSGLDKDEYVANFWRYDGRPALGDTKVWDGDAGVRWISVFWVVGGSEGYYVHIERIMHGQPEDRRECMLLAKFWDVERAEACVAAVQRAVNGYWPKED